MRHTLIFVHGAATLGRSIHSSGLCLPSPKLWCWPGKMVLLETKRVFDEGVHGCDTCEQLEEHSQVRWWIARGVARVEEKGFFSSQYRPGIMRYAYFSAWTDKKVSTHIKATTRLSGNLDSICEEKSDYWRSSSEMGRQRLKSRTKHVPHSIVTSSNYLASCTQVLQSIELVTEPPFLSSQAHLGAGWKALRVVAVVGTARGSGRAGCRTRPSTTTALAVDRLSRSRAARRCSRSFGGRSLGCGGQCCSNFGGGRGTGSRGASRAGHRRSRSSDGRTGLHD